MGSRSKYVRRRGEALVPRAVLRLLQVAAGAKAPTTGEDVTTAREVSRRMQSICRPHYVSAKRLRDNHGWSAAQSYEPWAMESVSGRVLVVPKPMRFGKRAEIQALAVVPEVVIPHDEADRADADAEWLPLGNSGKGKPIADLPSWGRLFVDPAGAGWLKDGLGAAVKSQERGGKAVTLIESSVEVNILLGYAYDLCAYWSNPENAPPTLTHAFDKDGALKASDDGAEAQTLAEAGDDDRAAWEDALATDAELDARAKSKRDDGGQPLPSAGAPLERGAEA